MVSRLPKAFVSWGSGKDSAYALLETRRQSIASQGAPDPSRIAPQRRLRPGAQERRVNAEPLARPRFDPGCPFCPGNEASLPGALDARSMRRRTSVSGAA